ncbi:hypothetical protein BJP40_11100 [Streptomyces sp. CC53]|uniref:hypothetical protein n=1 Tax=unclassified Streptomyces TaxID=2593676 RepID=UPI0008DE4BED|nr:MULTISPECIES: hypothetical protein [unclassified Streptomyces]OII60211.1 hypothetical protein BJP40_11100 [Streptomyces sp. CC53]
MVEGVSSSPRPEGGGGRRREGSAAARATGPQRLAAFAHDCHALLRQLAALPRRPTALVNEYHGPFGNDVGCLASAGITPQEARVLRSWLARRNSVVSEGARDFGFTAVPQHFDGHGSCSDAPFVQGPGAEAPLHPTIAGELALALADQQALTGSRAATPPSGTPPPPWRPRGTRPTAPPGPTGGPRPPGPWAPLAAGPAVPGDGVGGPRRHPAPRLRGADSRDGGTGSPISSGG